MASAHIAQAFRLAVLLAAISLALLVGGHLIKTGWSGLSAGEIVISRKTLPAFLATSTGPHAFAFYFEVWFRMLAGAFFTSIAVAAPLKFIAASPSQRSLMLAGTLKFKAQRRLLSLPLWVTGAVIVFLVHFLGRLASNGA